MDRKDVYSLVEQILQRPLNRFDFDKCEYYFTKYEAPYVQVCLNNLLEKVRSGQVRIFSTQYIDNYMFNNYEFYIAMKKSMPDQVVKEVEEKQKVEDGNMCKEAGWEGCTKDEQEYLIKLFAHTLYPEKHPKPDNPNGYNY